MYDLRSKIRSIFLEGRSEDLALSLLKKAGKESEYDKLLTITYQHKDNPAAKNNKHLPKLVQFYLDGTSTNIIETYYDKFINNSSISNKPIDTMKFHDFEQLVDSSVEQPKQVSSSAEITDPPYYEDENVKVYRGMNKQECIKYGKGRKFGFCISRSDSSNLFYAYRVDGATFYFIHFKTVEAQAKAPAELIVIHAYPNDVYQINYSKPNSDSVIPKEDIVSQFPVLSGVIDKLEYIPHTEHEEKLFSVQDKQIIELKTLDEKLLWIELGQQIDDEVWSKFVDKQEVLVDKYIEVGHYLIPEEIISKYPKLVPRYKEKMTQLFKSKIDNGIRLSIDEQEFGIDNDLLDIEYIAKSPAYSYEYVKFVLKGQNVPPEIMASIAGDSKYSYLYARDVLKWQNVPPEIMASIATDPLHSYYYAKYALGWQNVPPEISASVAKMGSKYSLEYASNVPKGQNVPPEIMASIAKDPHYLHQYKELSPVQESFRSRLRNYFHAR